MLKAKLMQGDPGRLQPAARALFVLCPVPGHGQDLEAFARDCAMVDIGFEVLAVNRAVLDCPGRPRHAASLHAEFFREDAENWLGRRKAAGLPAPECVHGTTARAGVEFVWRFRGGSMPSSGMLGVLLGQRMGYETVITNARLDANYAYYRDKWRRYRKAGALDNVFHYGPASDPEGASFVAGLLPKFSKPFPSRGGRVPAPLVHGGPAVCNPNTGA